VEDATGYKKLELLHVFNMTIPGIPIVYYGDEIGMPGAGDPDNRRMMTFGNLSPEEQHVKVTVRQLAQMRAQNMALLYGDFKELLVTETVWVYSRVYMNNKVIVCMNKGNTPAIIDLELPPSLAGIQSNSQGQQQGSQSQQGQGNQGGSSTQSGAARLSLTIPAYGYEILVTQ
jgi:glycosidase